METSNKYSGKELRRPEIDKPFTRTLEDIILEIQEIINNTHRIETRLSQLRTKGFQIESCWVKNGNIGRIWYMKRKQVYRIQVTTSELHGDYHKAYCVVIPFNDISMQIKEMTKVRNISRIL